MPLLCVELPAITTQAHFANSPETFVDFLSNLPGNFALKNGGDFWLIFFWSLFPTKRRTKTPRQIRGKFGAKFGAKSGTNTRKIRGVFVLQLF